jgi:hypothetical protein
VRPTGRADSSWTASAPTCSSKDQVASAAGAGTPAGGCPAQAATGWWWQRPPEVARAAHGAPAFVRPPLSPQRAGTAGCSGAGAVTTGRTKGRTTASWTATGSPGSTGARGGVAVVVAGRRRPARRCRATAAVTPAVTAAKVATWLGRMPLSSAPRVPDGTLDIRAELDTPESRARHPGKQSSTNLRCRRTSDRRRSPAVRGRRSARGPGARRRERRLPPGGGRAESGRPRPQPREPPRRGGSAGCTRG